MPELGIYAGRAAIRGFVKESVGAYEEFEVQAEEIRDFGNGVTFAVVVLRGRLRGSAGSVQFRYAGLATLVGGPVERTNNYTDIDEARTAAERLADERG